MNASIQNIHIQSGLKEYIDGIFLIESNINRFDSGLDIVEPDGSVKLAMSLSNPIQSLHEKTHFICEPNRLTVTGLFDSYFQMEGITAGPAKLLIVQLNAFGAYRFLNMNLEDILNNFCFLDNVTGRPARGLEDLMFHEPDVHGKIMILQNHLQNIFNKPNGDIVFDHCVKEILRRAGSVTLKELEKDTGYSARWLNMKFKDRIGVSSKSYASIIRFNHVFKQVVRPPNLYFKDRIYLDHYYDQTHFLKNFKRYSGQTLGEFYSKH